MKNSNLETTALARKIWISLYFICLTRLLERHQAPWKFSIILYHFEIWYIAPLCCVLCLAVQSCPALCDTMNIASWAPLSMGFLQVGILDHFCQWQVKTMYQSTQCQNKCLCMGHLITRVCPSVLGVQTQGSSRTTTSDTRML